MLSDEYIRGLVEGEGTFTFSTNSKFRRKVPAFAIKMHFRDEELLRQVRDTLKLRNKVYVYHHPRKDGYKSSPQAMLIVREFNQLKDIIIPFFYKKLKGNKGRQFNDWLERIWKDPDVPHSFKFLYKLCQWGHFEAFPNDQNCKCLAHTKSI